MAKGDHTDLFMIFVDKSGKPINGESRTILNNSTPPNPLAANFSPGKMFEIDKFTLSASGDGAKKNKLIDPKSIADPVMRHQFEMMQQQQRLIAAQTAQATALAKQGGPGGQNQAQTQADDPPVQPISFTRAIDAASPIMMTNMINCTQFQSASLIKRRGAGGNSAGEVYLRIDFTSVLIVSIDWDDDDKVNETCKFICKKVAISYRPQLPDGSLGAVVPGQWPAARS